MEFRRVTTHIIVGVVAVGSWCWLPKRSRRSRSRRGPADHDDRSRHVRIAHNNEGFVTLGYRIVNEWSASGRSSRLARPCGKACRTTC
jgi:hypothetical protein